MGKHETSPATMGQALAMREAGYTALAISHRLNISVRTLQRHFAASGTVKGTAKATLYKNAVEDLLTSVTSEESLKAEAARLLADDLAHSRHLRDVMHEASLLMTAKNLAEAVLVMRAAAAYSTAIKNTSDIVRHGLRLDRFDDTTSVEMPELIVSELTADDIHALREGHRLHDESEGKIAVTVEQAYSGDEAIDVQGNEDFSIVEEV